VGYPGEVGSAFKGMFYSGPKEAIGGIVTAVSDPVQTGKGIKYAVTNPDKAISAIAADYAEKAQTSEGQGMIGFELIVTVATMGGGAAASGGSKGLTTSTKLANVVDKLGDVAVVVDKVGDAAVVVDKVGDAAVVVDKLGDAAVAADKLGDAAKAADKVSDAAKTTDKLAEGAKASDKVGDTAKGAEKASDVSEGIVYRRTDKTGKIEPYGGQAKSEARFIERQSEHARAHPDADFEFELTGRAKPGEALDILEHQTIQEMTGGVAARKSPLVSNLKDPVGPLRRKKLGLPEPRLEP
jgi:hypothetical protein